LTQTKYSPTTIQKINRYFFQGNSFDVVIVDSDKCSSTIQRKFFDFSWQQMLRDNVTVLRYAYSGYVAFFQEL